VVVVVVVAAAVVGEAAVVEAIVLVMAAGHKSVIHSNMPVKDRTKFPHNLCTEVL